MIYAYGERRERQQQRRRAFAAITFPLYEPRLRAAYLVPGGRLLATQRASVPGVVEELGDRCGSGPRHPGGAVKYSPSSCRPHPTPGGRLVSDDGRGLATLFGATRVRIEYDPSVARTRPSASSTRCAVARPRSATSAARRAAKPTPARAPNLRAQCA